MTTRTITSRTSVTLELLLALFTVCSGAIWRWNSWSVADALWKSRIEMGVDELKRDALFRGTHQWDRKDQQAWRDRLQDRNHDLNVPPVSQIPMIVRQ